MVELVERMLRLYVKNRTLTADSFHPAAPAGRGASNTSGPLAVNRRLTALRDTRVHELYGLTEEETAIAEDRE